MNKWFFVLLVLIVQSANVYADGAMAKDSSNGKLGLSVNEVNEVEANKSALRFCNSSNCQIVGNFKNSCAAWAADKSFSAGSTGAQSIEDADKAAIQECSKNSANCRVVLHGCDKSNEPKEARQQTYEIQETPSASPSKVFDQAREAFARGDSVKAAEILLPLAQSGNADAETTLSWIYLNKDPKNITDGMKFLKSAVSKNNSEAQFELGLCYFKGECGLKEDRFESLKYIKLAVNQGHQLAKNYIDYYGDLKDFKGAIWIKERRAVFGEETAKGKEFSNILGQMDDAATDWRSQTVAFNLATLSNNQYAQVASSKVTNLRSMLDSSANSFVSLWNKQELSYRKKFIAHGLPSYVVSNREIRDSYNVLVEINSAGTITEISMPIAKMAGSNAYGCITLYKKVGYKSQCR